MVHVPRYQELSAKNLLNDAYKDPMVRVYLPDFNEGRHLSREFLFNVSINQSSTVI